MKKYGKALGLCRETLSRLDGAALAQLRGGIFQKQPPPPTGGCVQTFTCAGCMPGE
jgi:hypothetical protein